MSDVLKKICTVKRAAVAKRKQQTPLAEVEALAKSAAPVRGFAAALAAKADRGQYALIAEIKKASPSAGLIRPDFNPAALARAYENAGAACLSILTEEAHFQGSDAHLQEARAAVKLPVIRKDFMLEPYQAAQARAWGADCILIILAAVGDDTARFLLDAAREWEMDALVEVHDESEMDRALALGAELIGINNRNLRTFETDLQTSVDLAGKVPQDRHLVAESGLFTHSDLQRLETEAGIGTFLVGESLMRQTDVEAATRRLLTGAEIA